MNSILAPLKLVSFLYFGQIQIIDGNVASL